MSARKRALLVVHRFWPHPGGSERLFYNVARRLAGRGLEITVFTTDAWHPESYHSPQKQRLRAGLETHEGLTIRRFALRNIPLQFKVLRAVSWLPFEVVRLLSGSPYVLVPGYLREVFRNRPAFDFIVNNHLNSRSGLQAAYQAATVVSFPSDAIEVKTNWIPVAEAPTTSTPPSGSWPGPR